MQINTPRTAEEVLDFCLNHISLGTYDKRFFTNIFISNILPRKAITTNQLSLFKKIVNKYHKQLSKHNFFAFELADLPWSLPVIESAAEYTKAIAYVKENQLILRTPYKQAFVQEFRSANLMYWDHNNKHYETTFGVDTLKKVLMIVEKHYEERQYSDEIIEILNDMVQYENVPNWDPRLYKINGNYIIASINESLYDALKDVTLNTDLPTLALLTSHGVSIDKDLVLGLCESMYNTPEKEKELMFALSVQPTCEYTELQSLKKLLKNINCDHIIYTSMYTTNKGIDDIEETIKNLEIPYVMLSAGSKDKSTVTQDLINRKYKMPVIIKFNSFSYRGLGSMFAGKVVQVVNSDPVDIK